MLYWTCMKHSLSKQTPLYVMNDFCLWLVFFKRIYLLFARTKGRIYSLSSNSSLLNSAVKESD